MNEQTIPNMNMDNQKKRPIRSRFFLVFFYLLILVLMVVSGQTNSALAHPGLTGLDSLVTISAFDRADLAPITPFRYIINEDIAHQAEDGTLPVFTNPHAYSPIVASGDDTTATVSLPPGKYLVSVVAGDLPPAPASYKSSGKHFTVDGSGGAVAVDVGLVAGPLPSASVVVEVFHDNHSVNGARDIPVEQGLEGFAVLLEDGTGEVSVDIYGNPICTQYNGAPDGEFPPGDIIGDSSGQCLTDSDGVVTIPNLGPLKYGVFVNPPNGSGWIQTSTIEGSHIIDVWVQEGNNGYLAEQGNLTALALFGFVQECDFGLCPELNNQGVPTPPNSPTPPQGSATITGRIREAPEDVPGPLGPIVPEPYIALNNLSGNDEQVYSGRGNPDGSFSIPNVAPGLYQIVIWDYPLDIIIQFFTVTVGPDDTTVPVGDIGVPRWFGVIEGYVYWDTGIDASGIEITGIPVGSTGPGPVPGAENGFRDCQPGAGPHDVANCELGVANQDLDIRFKDGSIKYATFSDANGYYNFPEVFPFPAFVIWEVGFGRQMQVGTMAYFTEPDSNGAPNTPIGYPYDPENMPGCPRDINGVRAACDPAEAFGPASLLQGVLISAGRYHWIDTGKAPYPAGENGGISGIVHYGVTRNEFAPFNAAAEDYEPGVPNVTINLYEAALDDLLQPTPCTAAGDGCPYGAGELKRVAGTGETFGTVVDSVETDSWDANLPTDCRYSDLIEPTPSVIEDLLCLEIFKNFAQLKDGVFDGGYAFEGVDPGAYIVEMVAPDGYRHIKEEDQNTDQGDDFVPQVPPPPCAGPLHEVNDARNPEHGNMTPLCESKFVRVVDGTNPPAEFYVMTDFDDSRTTAGAVIAVGNPLIDRQYASDFPVTTVGDLSPVFVVVPTTALPDGILQSFQTWNQANQGGSPFPSAGNVFHAYVLRPTVNPYEYEVIFDSGLRTVPPLTNPAGNVATFPVPNVPVQAGDRLAFYGQGIPIDIETTGPDILNFPAPNPPLQGSTITLGTVDFPIYPQARTYSFGAQVLDLVPTSDFAGTAAVPPPAFIRGFMSDDLNVDFRPDSPNYRLKRGVPNTAIGILDFMDNEIAVVNTDEHGYFEVLLPSGITISCPTPGGICPAMYKVVGNYPGQNPLIPNPNWNPNYSTLTLPTDLWTGKTTYSDVAIIPITAFAGFEEQPVCAVTGPDVRSVDAVHGPAGTLFTISGSGFGTSPGTVSVGGILVGTAWTSDTEITVDTSGAPEGPGQVVVTDANGVASQTGITFHVTGGSYTPTILDVYPSTDLILLDPSPLQDAVDIAVDGQALIVVHPGTYYESLIVHKNVKIQGFGPGATSIDARFFGFGPAPASDPEAWIAKVDALEPIGPTEVPIGQVVTVVATSNNQHNNAGFTTQIDGFFVIGGGPFAVENRAPRLTQGGGIYAHASARRLQVSNNLIQSNSGNTGGGVVLGQAYVGDNNNDNVRIHHNRVLNNGGFIQAGGIGVFAGADGYEIDHNLVCGNYSAEYGGGISHFGLSSGGQIHDNKIVFNSSFDEGGGVMIASELSLDPAAVPDGSGEVTIERNLIQQNVSNDDGGGIRLLAPIDGPVHIINNMIVNNLATDIGGGIALDDALEVEIINNTIAHNVSTATAEDADRSPACAPNGGLESCAHAAGIASTGFSAALLDSNPTPVDTFTDPLMFNNIIWQNEAFHLDTAGNLVPDPAGTRPGPIIDLEVLGTPMPQTMTPEYSVLTAAYGSALTNTFGDPLFVDASVFVNFQALPFVADPAFVTVQVLTTPADNQGNYHLLNNTSPAFNLGVLNFGGVSAPLNDIDGDTRDASPDSGADEIVVVADNAPIASVFSPANGTTVGQYGAPPAVLVPIQIAASDVEDAAGTLTVSWDVDGGALQTATWNPTTLYYEASWDTAGLPTETYTINTFAQDSAGNITTASSTVTVDNGTAPTVSVFAPADGSVVTGLVTIQIDASDVEDNDPNTLPLVVTWDVDGGALQTATWNPTTLYYEATWDTGPLLAGSYTINTWAEDSDLLVSTTASSTVTVTKGEPIVSIFAPADGSNVAGDVTVLIEAIDLEDDNPLPGTLTVMWDVDGGTVQAATYNSETGYYEADWDTTTATNGSHTISASAEDSAGNITTASSTVTVDNASPMHVGDLDGLSTPTRNQKRWNANVAVTVHEQDHSILVSGATVTFEVTRIQKAGGTAISTKSCTTNASGTCTVTQSVNENNSENKVTFVVTNVSHATLPYLASANHDPDPQGPPVNPDYSDGTTIEVIR